MRARSVIGENIWRQSSHGEENKPKTDSAVCMRITFTWWYNCQLECATDFNGLVRDTILKSTVKFRPNMDTNTFKFDDTIFKASVTQCLNSWPCSLLPIGSCCTWTSPCAISCIKVLKYSCTVGMFSFKTIPTTVPGAPNIRPQAVNLVECVKWSVSAAGGRRPPKHKSLSSVYAAHICCSKRLSPCAVSSMLFMSARHSLICCWRRRSCSKTLWRRRLSCCCSLTSGGVSGRRSGNVKSHARFPLLVSHLYSTKRTGYTYMKLHNFD